MVKSRPIHKLTIEYNATNLRSDTEKYFGCDCIGNPSKYLDYLSDTGHLTEYDFTDKEGLSENILGKFEFHNKRILIYEGLKHHIGRENFTICHEIGHLILHYPLFVIQNRIVENSLNKPAITFSCNREMIEDINQCKVKDNLYWLEWQANYFARCLLMPTDYLKELYNDFEIKPLDFKFKTGITYTNTDLLLAKNDLIGYVSHHCKSSRKASEIRLKELNLLNPNYLLIEDNTRISIETVENEKQN